MFNIVFYNPQIPNNTGAIGRVCVNTGAKLHLIKPLGFDIDEKAVRRAGLDYWKNLSPTVWDDWESFEAANSAKGNFYFATTKYDKPYFEATYSENDFLIFGSETQGLPESLLAKNEDLCITIPMTKEGRSLNLSIAASIVLYEAIKQNFEDFKGFM
ncbi:MAG: tRNA (cytidine(34)-2'-O)-methyltransferase [Thiovulaceae bacterium]|nr:tRNA (cytidine(34)-2'-O)-methyltransferase [Sulfurimonadaceae bacterium]